MRSFNPIYEQLDNLPNQQLSIYLFQIALKRGERLISGSGHLQIVEDKFELTLLNSTPPEPIEESINGWTSMDEFPSAGKLLRSADDYCYEMEASDSHGNCYGCKYVALGDEFESRVYKCTFRSRITIRSEEITRKDHVSILFRNSYSFAGNEQEFEKTTFPTYLQPFPIVKKRLSISTGNLKLSLQSTKNGHQLDIESAGNALDHATVKRVTDSLNFVMGTEHIDYYIIFFGDNNSFEIEMAVHDKLVNKHLYNPPYSRNGSWGDEAEVNIELFKCYYRFLENNPDTILNKIHKRIVDSNSGYYYRHGLIISICVESVCRKYHGHRH